ncbi:NAD(P)-dependent dehydrogenase (short-subunit alcohol dehydrogenase family) [Herbaspirillum sp. Sphag1AN]|uniref:oxidoreductase n=1 Tax=unclassified Herbaspirillum TaxID=2624150 RepID=UPI001622147B|nr:MULTISPECIES: oxidoreductase [unclassified Herbaspirillum]MBB3213005.1 NAD(P)-dependent dehydrogenase (short-subunit alcohol dehydrogenase family) [Herbaspirillum sp. Sphag1AN]MBB3246202.1 NAD(P)-dependent dehydrogenase (short-subunit alcohol dehydrogenase family) [Herbaspirillum sp. Sphag64]
MLKDKIVVVTGGAGLIGRSFAKTIAEQGGVAVIADRDESGGRAAVEAIQSQGYSGQVIYGKLDITSKQSINDLIADLHQRYGSIDAVVNNAYPRTKQYGRKFEDVTFEDFNQNVSLHLGGYFLTAQQFAAYFKTQGSGNIINMASIYGVIAPRFDIYDGTAMTMPVEYAAIKSAVIHLTKYMARYFQRDNIRVNCISPGGILDGQPTEFLERYNSRASSKGMLDPADLQGVLLFLLGNMSTYVNGQNIVVDDGWSL